MSAATSALMGGRPVWFGQVHLRVIRRRCQRMTVPGGDQPVPPQPCWQEPDECGKDCAVGPVEPGPGMVLRSTAASCRSTSSSAALEGAERPSRTSQPQPDEDEVEQAQGHG
jgi:hypothetical protein